MKQQQVQQFLYNQQHTHFKEIFKQGPKGQESLFLQTRLHLRDAVWGSRDGGTRELAQKARGTLVHWPKASPAVYALSSKGQRQRRPAHPWACDTAARAL